MGRAFSIFRQKMDDAIRSEMDIKVSIPAPNFRFQSEKGDIPYMEKGKISP